jgi:mannose-6-phosphate isomerase-like protein (cupin superfamily)
MVGGRTLPTVTASAVPPFAVPHDEGERLAFGGTTMVVRAAADTTGGSFTLLEEVTPLLDTPTHVHSREDEMYYVVEGDHVFVCGEQEFHLGPGGLVFLPRGIPHAHRRLVPGVGRLLVILTPAGLEGFFRILAEATRSGGPMDEAYARASRDYGITWLA